MFSACSDKFETERRAITMCVDLPEVFADVKSSSAEDKVNAVAINGIPSEGLSVSLWYSYELGKYQNSPEQPQYIPCFTTVTYNNYNRVPVKTDEQNSLLYPIAADANYSDTDNGNVYCVGFYPDSGWSSSSEGSTSKTAHDINGSDDLMFADQMKGSYSDNFSNQTFSHLTVWLKINLSATSMKAAEVWGDVTDLVVVSPNREVMINFAETEGDSSSVSYSGDPVDFNLALLNNKLSITNKTFGQAFCAPPAKVVKNDAGKYEYSTVSEGELGYIVRVKTNNLPEKEVFVELKNEDMAAISNAQYAKGKLFVITLHFNDVAVVEGVCTLRQWDDQISDIYLENESFI